MERYRHDAEDDEGFCHGHDSLTDRPVFIRYLPRALTESREGRERFLAEARKAARLKHPNIVEVYDVGGHGRDFIVMESLGPSLKKFCETPMERRSLSERDRRRVLQGVLEALDFAHGQGVIHNCLCRRNVRLFGGHRVKVYGFGFDLVERQFHPFTLGEVVDEFALYMAPEQIRGEPADARTDLYAVGVLMHALWTGRHPFLSDSLPVLVAQQLRGARLELEGVPKAVASTISRCLAVDPAERFQDVGELRAHLDG